MQNIKDWLDEYDALDAEYKDVEKAMEAAEESGNYGYADEASADLDEKYSELAHRAADMLRELYTNSTLPSERGEKSWQHLDGSFCVSKHMLTYASPTEGVCEEHDSRVVFR